MISVKKLKMECARCGELDRNKCRQCPIYQLLNNSCRFCGKKGGVVPFLTTTRRGIKKYHVCPQCLGKLT